tara:strand:- start:398 stop:856 length:459 start_codon:yes stop_codon:yes gene_type:complete
MIKTLVRAVYSSFIFIVLSSIFLAGWTCFTFISQPTKSGEIINVIEDMYESQKSVIVNVVDLSKLLIKDTNVGIPGEGNNLLTESESEFLTDQENKSLFDEPSTLEDNGDNPLGIVIEPFSPNVSEKNFPDISLRQSDSDHSEVSMNETEMN